MSRIIFWRHVWRQKDGKLWTCIHLPSSGKWAFAVIRDKNVSSVESSFVECGQLSAGIEFGSLLTPDMASKNDASNGIDYSLLGQPDAMSGIVFWRHMSCVNKLPNLYPVINCPTSTNEASVVSIADPPISRRAGRPSLPSPERPPTLSSSRKAPYKRSYKSSCRSSLALN